MLRFRNLASGSTGNATLVEGGGVADQPARRLLVDCGLGIRQLEWRLGAAGVALDQLDAVFITHEHPTTSAACRSWRCATACRSG